MNFDPFSEEYKTNPYNLYDRLREGFPVVQKKIAKNNSFWFVSKYEDIEFVLKDNRFVREYQTVFPNKVWTPPSDQIEIFEIFENWVLFRDPPAHTRLRKIISRAFQQLMAKVDIETLAKKNATTLLNNISSSFDLITDFAEPFPMHVFCDLLGVPKEDWKMLKRSSDLIISSFDIKKDPAFHKKIGNDTILEMKTYFNKWIDTKRNNPDEDLISILTNEVGEDFSDLELMSNLLFLLVAGHETTSNLISNSIFALINNPDQEELLRKNEYLTDQAIEEFLRYDSPIQMTYRLASEDLTLGNATIKKGDSIALLLGSANRDEKVFTNPGTLNIERTNSKKHLSFAIGIHFCVGAMLAKMEAKYAIQCILQKFPKLNPQNQNHQWGDNPSFRSLTSLKLQVKA